MTGQEQPTVIGGDGTGVSQETTHSDQQMQQTTQETVVETTVPTKPLEEIEAERKRAITEAIENKRKLDTVTNDAKRTELRADLFEAFATNDQTVIAKAIESASSKDKETTDKILMDKFGVSSSEALLNLQSNASDIDAIVEQKMQERDKMKLREHIKNAEVEFFNNTTLHPNSATFKQVMDEYATYEVKTPEQAKQILDMIYRNHGGTSTLTQVTGNPIKAASSPISMGGGASFQVQSSGKQRTFDDPVAQQVLVDRYGEDAVKKFLSGKPLR